MNNFIAVEAEKCIGCRTCEIACAVVHTTGGVESLHSPKHFHPRLRVVRDAKISLPVLCRHCENAPCANVCPTHAIICSQNAIQVVQELCIGCKGCVIACPFGVMTVISEEMTSKGEAPKSEALKCDLCIDHASGPACVSSCPTHALSLVDRESLEKMIHQKQMRIASEEASIQSGN